MVVTALPPGKTGHADFRCEGFGVRPGRALGSCIAHRRRRDERREARGEKRVLTSFGMPRIEVPRTVLHVAPAIFDAYMSCVHIRVPGLRSFSGRVLVTLNPTP